MGSEGAPHAVIAICFPLPPTPLVPPHNRSPGQQYAAQPPRNTSRTSWPSRVSLVGAKVINQVFINGKTPLLPLRVPEETCVPWSLMMSE